MSRRLSAWSVTFITTVGLSVFWHVVLFRQAFLQLGVYTRMHDPLYRYGWIAWLMECTTYVLLYFHSSWCRQGRWGALKFSWLMAAFTAASSVFGSAAKMDIANLDAWFLLSGSFVFLHFTLMGLVLGQFSKLPTDLDSGFLNAKSTKC